MYFYSRRLLAAEAVALLCKGFAFHGDLPEIWNYRQIKFCEFRNLAKGYGWYFYQTEDGRINEIEKRILGRGRMERSIWFSDFGFLGNCGKNNENCMD